MSIFKVNYKSKFSKKIISFLFIINSIVICSLTGTAKPEFIPENEIEIINSEYLNSRNELRDYILDTGDILFIEFFPAKELNAFFTVNEEGEIFLPRIKETYVRGLTIFELEELLKNKYLDYLINPEIEINIAEFKEIRVLVSGEVRNPGIHKFPSYRSKSFSIFLNKLSESNTQNISEFDNKLDSKLDSKFDSNLELIGSQNQNPNMISNISVKRSSENVTTISNAIKKAGGITSKSDLSKVEIIRDIPLSKGGGKKKAIIDFRAFINNFDPSNDIRLFDGDRLNIARNTEKDFSIMPKSIISGLSPKFIDVDIFGRVENPGPLKLPLESSLSDAIDLSGPRKPLSGKISIIRYENDGTVIKKLVNYSYNAKKGSSRNPYLKKGDIISVRNSFIGQRADIIQEITLPFVGITQTKDLINDF